MSKSRRYTRIPGAQTHDMEAARCEEADTHIRNVREPIPLDAARRRIGGQLVAGIQQDGVAVGKELSATCSAAGIDDKDVGAHRGL